MRALSERILWVKVQDSHLLWYVFPHIFPKLIDPIDKPSTPQVPDKPLKKEAIMGFKVWAFPTSLAVTTGIIVIFFSSSY